MEEKLIHNLVETQSHLRGARAPAARKCQAFFIVYLGMNMHAQNKHHMTIIKGNNSIVFY